MFTRNRSHATLLALLLGGALLLPGIALADHHEDDGMQQDAMSDEAMEEEGAMKHDAMGEEGAMDGDAAMKSEGDDAMADEEDTMKSAGEDADDEMMEEDDEM